MGPQHVGYNPNTSGHLNSQTVDDIDPNDPVVKQFLVQVGNQLGMTVEQILQDKEQAQIVYDFVRTNMEEVKRDISAPVPQAAATPPPPPPPQRYSGAPPPAPARAAGVPPPPPPMPAGGRGSAAGGVVPPAPPLPSHGPMKNVVPPPAPPPAPVPVRVPAPAPAPAAPAPPPPPPPAGKLA